MVFCVRTSGLMSGCLVALRLVLFHRGLKYICCSSFKMDKLQSVRTQGTSMTVLQMAGQLVVCEVSRLTKVTKCLI